MMKTNYLCLLLFLLVGCGKNQPKPEEVNIPKNSVLISPLQNEVCTTGVILSDTESNITFVWSAAQYAETYELNYTNLETGRSGIVSTSNTSVTVKLLRNTPYSWKVTAKSFKTTAVSASEVWKFYNAGIGATSYAPYPAELTLPLAGSTITPATGKISLSWSGTDPDGDIIGYDIYFGTTSNPQLYRSDLNATNLAGVPVNNNTIYYWMVVSKDSKGNTSNSGINQFKTN